MISLVKIYNEIDSPLSSKEEKVAKKLKPALQKMIQQYGKEKGKEFFYGMIRNKAKRK
jgi:hypothetical protein